MRILIAGTTYFPATNGQAIFTVNLAEGLAKRGHDVLMVYPSETGSPYSDERHGVQREAVSSISLRRWHESAYFNIFSGQTVHRLVKSFQPEIIHIQDHYILCRDFALGARRYGIKSLGTNHYMPENLAPYVPLFARAKKLYNWIGWKWMIEVYHRLDVATAQSRASAALVKANGLRIPIFPVSCGIDLEHFYPDPTVDRLAVRAQFGIDPQRTAFLFVGRVDKEKKLEVLLHALHRLDRDDIQLVITGKGAALKEIRLLARTLNLGKKVHFTGFVADEYLPALLNSVDIFTMPSEAELLSIATLEAMACGRPLLLANAVALPELVKEGVNGYLFKPSDPADAARLMTLLADHPEQWAEMGAASRRKVRRHGLDIVIQRYEDIYRALLTNSTIEDLEIE